MNNQYIYNPTYGRELDFILEQEIAVTIGADIPVAVLDVGEHPEESAFVLEIVELVQLRDVDVDVEASAFGKNVARRAAHDRRRRVLSSSWLRLTHVGLVRLAFEIVHALHYEIEHEHSSDHRLDHLPTTLLSWLLLLLTIAIRILDILKNF